MNDVNVSLGYAEVTVEANSAPTGGSITVLPSSGVQLNTTFEISTAGWQDNDEPFSYRFWYKVGNDAAVPLTSVSGQDSIEG